MRQELRRSSTPPCPSPRRWLLQMSDPPGHWEAACAEPVTVSRASTAGTSTSAHL